MNNLRLHRGTPSDQYVSSYRRRILPLMLGVCCTLLFLCLPSVLAQEKTLIYFYSAETNISNFKFLKMEFDKYLANLGPYEFQPFSDRQAFEQHIQGKEHALLMLSSWHYLNIAKTYGLKPVLVGSRNGQKYQKRVLVTTDQSADLETIKSGQIASASSVQHTKSTLGEIFNNPAAADSLKILTVPKDIDALMSVGFGMAKSALITESSLAQLESVNPALYKKMRILAESEASLLLIVAVPENFVEGAQQLITIIQQMSANQEGKKNIKLLGFDDWQELDSVDTSKLEG